MGMAAAESEGEMTNPELDTIVAERMGWERERRCRYMGPGVECVHTASLPCPMVEARQCDGAQQARPPSITTDWAVFGEALERLKEMPCNVDIGSHPVCRKGLWIVHLHGPTYLDEPRARHCERLEADLRVALAEAVAAMPKEAFDVA